MQIRRQLRRFGLLLASEQINSKLSGIAANCHLWRCICVEVHAFMAVLEADALSWDLQIAIDKIGVGDGWWQRVSPPVSWRFRMTGLMSAIEEPVVDHAAFNLIRPSYAVATFINHSSI